MGFFKSNFMSSNSTSCRLARTIAQGIIGVIIANIDLLIGAISIPTEWKPFIVAMVMAVLSPIMGALSGNNDEEKHDTEAEGLEMLKEAQQAEGYIGEKFDDGEEV